MDINNLCLVKKVLFMKEKNFFFSSKKTIFLDFYKFNCPSIFIAQANTIKWRYALAKALAFLDC